MREVPLTGFNPRDLAIAVNQLIRGKRNNVGTITLTASVASTTLTNALIASGSVLILTPKTANAAAELGNGTLYVTGPTMPGSGASGSFTINHANNAQVDRTYFYEIAGG